MKTLKDFNVSGKRALVRCDFNVPLSKKGPACAGKEILDDFRIKKSLPTIRYLMEKRAKLILMSHLGRPEGRVADELKMDPVQVRLTEYLDVSVTKAPDCLGEEIERWTQKMMPGEILILENLRFHKEEEENDPGFSEKLAKLGDVYVNDAFGASHRVHASIVGVPKLLPSCAGLLLEREIKVLSDLLENPQKPLVAIIGGKKVETKIKAINKISESADTVLVGGLIKKELEEKGIRLENPEKIIGPVNNLEGKDIGPETVRLFKEKIAGAKTVFWSGPLGKIEEEEFCKGSKEIARAVIESCAFSIAGGGETVEFINRIGLGEKFGHLSTGGGAMLEFLSGDELPGIKALEQI